MSALNFIIGLFRPRRETITSGASYGGILRLSGNWGYDQEVVGEANYQQELDEIAGPKTPEGVELKLSAELICEQDNPHDAKAVAVVIEGAKVAYLSRTDAVEYRKSLKKIDRSLPNAICRAKIVGGWERSTRGKIDQGHFGVKLDLVWPLRRIDESRRR